MKHFISNLFKNKRKARFINVIPGVEIAHPVVPSNDIKPAWLKEAAAAWKEQNRIADPHAPHAGGSIIRCPGLIDFFKRGYVIPAPFDFTITTFKDDNINFAWNCSLGNKIGDGAMQEPPITGHPEQHLSAFMPWRIDTLRSVVKVQTFWRFQATDDIVFLLMPYPYADHNHFTSVHGIFDPQQTSSINIQLLWHHTGENTTLIKAGTPLAQMIPMPREFAIDLMVDIPNEEDVRTAKAAKYLLSKDYNKNIKQWKEATGKLFKWK
jgi:hypothetical protein